MTLTDQQLEFLRGGNSAAMVTIGEDGMPKVARVGVALVDGKVRSSGTRDRRRTERVRKDPRATLFVFKEGFAWLALESTVTVLDGPDIPDESVTLFRTMQGKPSGPLSWFDGELEEDAFKQTMVDDGRIIFEFEVHRAYGMI